MRLLPRRRSKTPAQKVADAALKAAQAGTKVLVVQRVARKGFKRYKLTKKIVPVAGLGAVALVVWRRISGGGDDGGGGSQPAPATPPPGPSTAASPPTATATGGSSRGDSPPAAPETPPVGAEAAAAASVAGDADEVPSPAVTAAGDVPDALGEQTADVPLDTAGPGGGTGESARGEGETPTEPELDVEGPNESAPGTHPSPDAESSRRA